MSIAFLLIVILPFAIRILLYTFLLHIQGCVICIAGSVFWSMGVTMARIKKIASYDGLDELDVFIEDSTPLSKYFELREFPRTLTGGINSFLILGTEFLQLGTDVKVEVLDAVGNPLYVEPGKGIPQYYEGTAKVVAVYVYDDTPIGVGKITIVGELEQYEDANGRIREVPEVWKDVYNVRWSTTLEINNRLANETKVRFYKRPRLDVTETLKPFYTRNIISETQTEGVIRGVAVNPKPGRDFRTLLGDTIYRLEISGSTFKPTMEGQNITIAGLSGFNNQGTYVTEIREFLNDQVALATTPYYQTSSVSSVLTVRSFDNTTYSITYPSASNYGLTDDIGSLARLKISRLSTFSGDVYRAKIFRRSMNKPGDYKLVTDNVLEAIELLRDDTSRDLQKRLGVFCGMGDSIVGYHSRVLGKLKSSSGTSLSRFLGHI
jgi:hypothetical protein